MICLRKRGSTDAGLKESVLDCSKKFVTCVLRTAAADGSLHHPPPHGRRSPKLPCSLRDL